MDYRDNEECVLKGVIMASTASSSSDYSMHTRNRLMTLCPGQPGWASTRRNLHPLTYEEEEEGFAQITRSIVWEIIAFTVLWASEGC